MEYKFYGFNTKAIKPINKEYEKIIDQRHLYDILKTIWSKETCAPRMQDRWSKDNYTLGQCSITSFLVQDIFGGYVYGILLDDGNYHCYNVIGDIIFDLTSEQFDHELIYDKKYLQSRCNHFKKEEKYNRYLYLKNELNKKLKLL